jgi:hypothetical protein
MVNLFSLIPDSGYFAAHRPPEIIPAARGQALSQGNAHDNAEGYPSGQVAFEETQRSAGDLPAGDFILCGHQELNFARLTHARYQ